MAAQIVQSSLAPHSTSQLDEAGVTRPISRKENTVCVGADAVPPMKLLRRYTHAMRMGCRTLKVQHRSSPRLPMALLQNTNVNFFSLRCMAADLICDTKSPSWNETSLRSTRYKFKISFLMEQCLCLSSICASRLMSGPVPTSIALVMSSNQG